MKEDEIAHEGIVVGVSNELIKVNITSKAACGGCAIKSSCGMSEMKNKSIDIYTKNGGEYGQHIEPSDYHVGQSVEVYMSSSKGAKAVLYGYFYPFVILMVVLVITLSTIKTEWISALIAIAAVSLYYLCLKFFFSKKLDKEFTFRIRNKGE